MALTTPQSPNHDGKAAHRNIFPQGALALAICALAALIASAFLQPALAFADDAPDDVPRSISGSCHIGETWMVGAQSFFTVPSFAGRLSGAAPVSAFECLDHTAAAPEHVDAWYEASLTDCNLNDGWVEYYVIITPPDATDGVTRNELGLVGYQRVGGSVRLAWDFKGGIALQKKSSRPDITDGNGCYSLKGALYGVFSTREAALTHDRAQSLRMLSTNDAGTWETGMDFAIGTYYVAEIEAPRGFVLDDAVYEVAIAPNRIAYVNAELGFVQDAPRTNPIALWAVKSDSETLDGRAQGAATLEGTQFTVSYYDGFYDAASLPAKPTRTWVVTADENGQAAVSDEGKVTGDEFYRLADGRITLPLGTVSIVETQAPEGYLPDAGDMRIIQINDDKADETVSAYEAPMFVDTVERGGVSFGKIDRQNGGPLPQGSATLEGAVFSIVSANPQPVFVDGTLYEPGQIVKTVETHLDGGGRYRASTASDCLPYGTYVAYESESSTGYIYDGESQSWSCTFSIDGDGAVVDLSDVGSSVANQVIRGDFAFSKIDGFSAERLGLVPFMVTSQTTGESHVIVTDENGMVSTASDWNAHSTSTNANDAAFVETESGYEIDERMLNPHAGVWFDGRVDKPCEIRDDLGALPFDTYTVSELRAPGNEGRELVTFDIIISREGRELDLGTVDDNAGAIVTTSLSDDNGEKLAAQDETAIITDAVRFVNLDVREQYTLLGTLHLVTDDGEDGGIVAEGSTTFQPASTSGFANVEFAVDTSELAGERLVAFEQLLDAQGNVQASHEDLAFEGQTVRVPSIGTTLVDAADGDHEATAGEEVTLIDTVSYRGLTPGVAYTIVGTLHMRGEEDSDDGVAHDANDREIAVRQNFVAEQSQGEVEVMFTFAAPDIDSLSMVAFEQLERKGVIYATHADISDEGQTVILAKSPEKPVVETPPEKPVPETPAAETPAPETPVAETPQLEQPAETPKPQTPTTTKASTMPTTGDTLFNAALVMIPAGALGLALAALSVRKLERENQIVIERGRPQHMRK